MKELRLSQLMDEYADHEFFPEEESAVNVEAVKARVLARVEIPPQRRKMPTLTRILLAAALAAGCLLSIAAALPIIAYHQIDGSSVLVQTDGAHYLYLGFDESKWEEPVVLEDGRLWLAAGGRHVDLTDLIDEETPFPVEGADPDSGLKSYLIVGGTPEDFGWETWAELPLGDYCGGGWNSYKTYVTVDGVDYLYNDLTEEQQVLASRTFTVNNAWCQNGREALHLWD